MLTSIERELSIDFNITIFSYTAVHHCYYPPCAQLVIVNWPMRTVMPSIMRQSTIQYTTRFF